MESESHPLTAGELIAILIVMAMVLMIAAGVGLGLYKRHQHQQEVEDNSRRMANCVVWNECD